MGVIGLKGAQRVARGSPFWPIIIRDFGAAGLADGKGEIDDLVARALDQVERAGMVCGAGYGEGRAVLQHAGDIGEGEFSGGEEVSVQGQFRHPPGMRHQRCGTGLEQMLEIAILLLVMLCAEEHTLLPDNLIIPSHDAYIPKKQLFAALIHNSAGLVIGLGEGLAKGEIEIVIEVFGHLLVKLLIALPQAFLARAGHEAAGGLLGLEGGGRQARQ